MCTSEPCGEGVYLHSLKLPKHIGQRALALYLLLSTLMDGEWFPAGPWSVVGYPSLFPKNYHNQWNLRNTMNGLCTSAFICHNKAQ